MIQVLIQFNERIHDERREKTRRSNLETRMEWRWRSGFQCFLFCSSSCLVCSSISIIKKRLSLSPLHYYMLCMLIPASLFNTIVIMYSDHEFVFYYSLLWKGEEGEKVFLCTISRSTSFASFVPFLQKYHFVFRAGWEWESYYYYFSYFLINRESKRVKREEEKEQLRRERIAFIRQPFGIILVLQHLDPFLFILFIWPLPGIEELSWKCSFSISNPPPSIIENVLKTLFTLESVTKRGDPSNRESNVFSPLNRKESVKKKNRGQKMEKVMIQEVNGLRGTRIFGIFHFSVTLFYLHPFVCCCFNIITSLPH